jgi:ketosteroid isomerase-like protein
MNRTHMLVLLLLLLISGFAIAQQNPPVAEPQPASPEQPGVAQPVGQPAAAAQPASPTASVEQERTQIRALVQQLDQAAVNNDTAVFDRLLAPNYTAINPQGVKEDKHDILKAHGKDEIKYESVQDRDEDIQVSGNTATERSTSDIRGEYKGQRFDGTYASTRTFQRQPDGSWQIVSFDVKKVK